MNDVVHYVAFDIGTGTQVKFKLERSAVGSADLKISKSAVLSLNHHNFSNTKPIYTE